MEKVKKGFDITTVGASVLNCARDLEFKIAIISPKNGQYS